jgi:hypothetical protein
MIKEINLLNKRILYLGPMPFHYDLAFVNKLREMGAVVDYFQMYPYSFYFKIIDKFKLPGEANYIKKFYEKIISERDYDYVLMRFKMCFDVEFLMKLKELNQNARFINFHWDSIKPEYDYINTIKYFDRVYSFDYKDCQDHPEVGYLPLFYLDIYEESCENEKEEANKIDLVFIGNWRDHERYNLIKTIDKKCEENKLKFYYYLYYPIKPQFDAIRSGFIAHESKLRLLSSKEIVKILSTSNTVIDFPSSFQTGLTMRTFEALAAGKKLITTNKNVIREPFYDPEYISILDTNNFFLDVDFLKRTPAHPIKEKIKNYSIGNYINQLLQ